MVAGTARWASQHYRSWISHGFQKLPTYIYIYIYISTQCLCTFMPVCGHRSLRRPPAAPRLSRTLLSSEKEQVGGEAVVVRPPPSPIPRLDTFAKRERCNNLQLVRSISFHQFPTFLTFLLFFFFFIHPLRTVSIYLSIHAVETHTRFSSNCLPPVLFSAG